MIKAIARRWIDVMTIVYINDRSALGVPCMECTHCIGGMETVARISRYLCHQGFNEKDPLF